MGACYSKKNTVSDSSAVRIIIQTPMCEEPGCLNKAEGITVRCKIHNKNGSNIISKFYRAPNNNGRTTNTSKKEIRQGKGESKPVKF
jgi:hypothetical protein